MRPCSPSAPTAAMARALAALVHERASVDAALALLA
jgi:hypothetical protein